MTKCDRCGYCCKNLYLWDRLLVSLHTKTIMLKKVCKFLKNNKCLIHKDKPKVCKEWFI